MLRKTLASPKWHGGVRCGSLFLAALTLLAAVGLSGCRSETELPEAKQPAEKHPETQTTTETEVDRPIDPADCMASECHEKMLKVSYRHQPVQAKACDSCHEPEQPDHKFPLKRAQRDLCTFCHPVVGHKEHVHKVITDQGCLPCHNPHSSHTKFLLTSLSTELLCQQCHKLERKAHLHGPFAVGQCTVCHQPHESDYPFLLLGGEGNEHCFICHQGLEQELANAQLVHKAIRDGCTGCHEPHSSDQAAVLTLPFQELCFKCHPEVGTRLANQPLLHGAVLTQRQCANCHDPHTQQSRLLSREGLRLLCLTCHDKPQKAHGGRTIPGMGPALLKSRFLHGPVRMGNCSACHYTHASGYIALLRSYFPPEFYEAFDLASYALCFNCHNPSMVLEEKARALTAFRNGDQNLHFVHVNREEKGRTCRTCHEIHGSNQVRHTAARVPFEGGAWSMAINFEPTEHGGRCSPGCHEPVEYRQTPLTPIPKEPADTPGIDP